MINPFVLLLLGLTVGILTGFFGVGGAFLLTPALNILGLHMVYAIGTGFFTLVGKTLFGAVKHHRLGNIDLRLGIIIGIFSGAGVELGKRLVLYLEKLNLTGTYVRVAYIILLVLISIFMMREYYLYLKTKQTGQEGETVKMQKKKSALIHQIHGIGLPPKISLLHGEVNSISIWVLIVFGILIGFLSGFMGLGGGFISLPVLIYVIGLPAIRAVGTTLVIVFFTSCYGTVAYAIAGRVEWIPGLIILAGSLIGVQMGVYATKYVTGVRIKILFALLLLFVAISVFLKQINVVTISSYIIVSSACALCLVILFPLGKNLLARTSSQGKSKSQS